MAVDRHEGGETKQTKTGQENRNAAGKAENVAPPGFAGVEAVHFFVLEGVAEGQTGAEAGPGPVEHCQDASGVTRGNAHIDVVVPETGRPEEELRTDFLAKGGIVEVFDH